MTTGTDGPQGRRVDRIGEALMRFARRTEEQTDADCYAQVAETHTKAALALGWADAEERQEIIESLRRLPPPVPWALGRTRHRRPDQAVSAAAVVANAAGRSTTEYSSRQIRWTVDHDEWKPEMGYQVYEDPAADRWAGYGVPAECDWKDCWQSIDRGMDYRCEEHVTYGPDGVERIDEGCMLFFCHTHLAETEAHQGAEPKPDSAEWMYFMLTDESWAPWRGQDGARFEALRKALKTATKESFLRSLYYDGYHPAHLIDQARDVLVRLADQIERDRPTSLRELYSLTHASTEEFNRLTEEGLEIETVAREAIASELGYLAAAYGFPKADPDELVAPRKW